MNPYRPQFLSIFGGVRKLSKRLQCRKACRFKDAEWLQPLASASQPTSHSVEELEVSFHTRPLPSMAWRWPLLPLFQIACGCWGGGGQRVCAYV